MARTPKRPTIGHNGGLPEQADLRTAAAAEMIFEEKEKKLRDEKKRMRSRLVEGKGITQDDVKFFKKIADMTPSEVIDTFRRQWHTVGAFFPQHHEQMDLFTKKSEAPVRAAYYTMGMVAGLQGKDFEPPPAVVGDDRQQMLDGHNEGTARRQVAWDSLAKGDEVVDGTGKTAAGKVGDQAAKDFAADNGGDPLTVGGIKYANMRQANAARKRQEAAAGNQAGSPAGDQGEGIVVAPEGGNDVLVGDGGGEALPPIGEGFLNDTSTDVVGDDVKPPSVEGTEAALPLARDGQGADLNVKPASAARPAVLRPDFHNWGEDWQKWTGPQTMEFRRWFESLPEDQPAPTHAGAADYFELLKEERENRRLSEQREADDAEFDKPREDTSMDPDVIADKAKKLAESGFVPQKSARRQRAAP